LTETLRRLREARFFAQEALRYRGLPPNAFGGFVPRAATSYATIQIFESLRKAPEEVLALASDLPLKPMRDMRNLLVHAYDEVDIDVLQSTVDNDLPRLVVQLEQLTALIEALG
jgi:uncharacterized protein with HEPN domain